MFEAAKRDVITISGLHPLNISIAGVTVLHNPEHESSFSLRLQDAKLRATERLFAHWRTCQADRIRHTWGFTATAVCGPRCPCSNVRTSSFLVVCSTDVAECPCVRRDHWKAVYGPNVGQRRSNSSRRDLGVPPGF